MKSKLFSHRNLPEMYNLDVDDGEKIYVEVSGKRDGIPAIFVHGGPGGHCRSEHHSLFNPEVFKSIIFDQRGCGKSTPYRSIKKNNTITLVEDIEKIRNFLGLKKFIIVGGSWGATLALRYAIKYPENLHGILLRSVFLGTMDEIQWAFIDGPKTIAPDLFKQFKNLFPKSKNLIDSYYNEICEKNSKLHSWIWHDYERILSQINPTEYKFDSHKIILNRNNLPNSPFMELHYIKNKFFMVDDEIVKNILSISKIPGIVVQGRYDLICPPKNAFRLCEKWKKSKLILVDTAGHSSSDPGIMEEMLDGLDQISKQI